MRARTALLDADIVAYAVAARNEQQWNFDDSGEAAVHIDREAAERDIHEVVGELQAAVKASQVVVCLSDPSGRYFRHDVFPAYKAKRKAVVKPALLMELKRLLAKGYPTYQRPALEADDCQGILATNKKLQQAKGYGECIVVSQDKDMRTLPVKVYNPNRPEQGVQRISELDADRFHLWQTVVGDATDGYPGCPGIGPESAFAQDLISADRADLWDCVLEAYASKGLTEADAIVQARCARILRHADWDYERKLPRLWTPTVLHGCYES